MKSPIVGSVPTDLGRPASDAPLWEYYDKNYHQLLLIIAKKVHQEKVQQEKLKAVKARLNFEEASQHSESGTPNRRRKLRKRLGSRRIRSTSGSPKPRRGRSESAKKRVPKRKVLSKDWRMVDTKSCYQSSRSRETKFSSEKHHNKRSPSQRTNALSKSKGNTRGHWKSKSKRQKLSIKEDDLSLPWVCEETDPFTPRIRYFDFLKTRMPSHIKTYDGSEDQEDHLKIFQAAAKMECWAMPTWCHMFNSTLTKMYKLECRDVKGALECMKILGFMYGITNPELIKRLHDKILKSVDEIMRVTTTFLRDEVADSNHERKNSFPSWK
ncbi:hypothetical protein Tco_0529402 [Tanacetum coccineum]